ncbi:e9imm peptide [Streptomyces sp. NPDC049585]|uniref:e9imm peptide n=1 Tax=Streptomyces sp. NPDC049585 TaxID=3155154 RepID=UPI00343BE731
MGADRVSRAEAVVMVQRIMDGDYASEEEVDSWLESYVSDLIFWPPQGELSADEVVGRALAYQPITL